MKSTNNQTSSSSSIAGATITGSSGSTTTTASAGSGNSKMDPAKHRPAGTIAYSTAALTHNHHLIEYCRTSMSALAGCTAGILGCTSYIGFGFYLVMVVVLWMMLMVKAGVIVGGDWRRYFTSSWAVLSNGFISGLTTYVLFWTFLYGMVHVY